MWDMKVNDTAIRASASQYPKQGVEAVETAQETPDKISQEVKLPQDIWETEREERPSLYETMKEARQKAEEQRKQLTIKTNKRYGDAPIEAYARLARAQNHAEVNAATGFARRRIVQLKSSLRQDSENSAKIRAAIQQLEKVVVRSGRKKRDLTQEATAEHRRERLAEEKRKREEMRVKTEQLRRKTMRVLRESGYFHEAAISDRLAAQTDMARAQTALPTQGTATQTPSATGIPPTVSAEQYNAAVAQYSAMTSLAPSPEATSFQMEV